MNINALIGLTLSRVEKHGNEQIIFETDDGLRFLMYHSQSCCEDVHIEDVCGNLRDLIGSPLLMAEESTINENPAGVRIPKYQDSLESFAWIFYRLATRKGYVTIRWYGAFNGCYSESVSFEEEVRIQQW